MPAADLAGRPDLTEKEASRLTPQFRKLVGDITYIHTREGCVYPAGRDETTLLEKNCWLRHGGTHANRIASNRFGHGGAELPARQGCDDSPIRVRETQSACPSITRHHEQVWFPCIGGKNRRVLRQRSSRYHSTPPAQERTH